MITSLFVELISSGRYLAITSRTTERITGITTSEYDGANRKIKETDALGNISETQYDGNDNPVLVTRTDKSTITQPPVPDEVFRSAMFRDLNMEPAFISDLGHWNFHGDNIILKDLGKPYAFRVIDPDINLERCDPLFGIARLFYSFPHDTADYHQYVIQAPIFASSEADRVDFLVDFLWPRLVYEKYARLFSCVYELDDGQLRSIDNRLSLSALMFRLKLNYLYCVMRGVNANYDERIEFVDRNITEFRNKAIFLYLQALVFAAHLKEFVDADHS
ncbi:MAG: RHS repeat protein [Candidatus Krumholzibacteriota bacterium]|nr:RHS repeat protein [Candidatus Krumholzibacteriota bacterium]